MDGNDELLCFALSLNGERNNPFSKSGNSSMTSDSDSEESVSDASRIACRSMSRLIDVIGYCYMLNADEMIFACLSLLKNSNMF